jgi:hypothetical protein
VVSCLPRFGHRNWIGSEDLVMRLALLSSIFVLGLAVQAAEVESRVLTHYLPQDYLETVVRTEGWTKVPLDVKGGVRKGDVLRIWTGGSIDRGNGDRPGQFVSGPSGPEADDKIQNERDIPLALASQPVLAFALLFKTESSGPLKSSKPGKPLEIKLIEDKEQLWIGFNDWKGRFQDNHLGRGTRHELDPLWVRIEVVRIIVD